jgi:hypothetical protein
VVYIESLTTKNAKNKIMFKDTLEYRGSICEKKEYIDKENGQKKSYVSLVHNFEDGNGHPVFVRNSGQVDPNLDPTAWKTPYTKGLKYSVAIALRGTDPIYAKEILPISGGR